MIYPTRPCRVHTFAVSQATSGNRSPLLSALNLTHPFNASSVLCSFMPQDFVSALHYISYFSWLSLIFFSNNWSTSLGTKFYQSYQFFMSDHFASVFISYLTLLNSTICHYNLPWESVHTFVLIFFILLIWRNSRLNWLNSNPLLSPCVVHYRPIDCS